MPDTNKPKSVKNLISLDKIFTILIAVVGVFQTYLLINLTEKNNIFYSAENRREERKQLVQQVNEAVTELTSNKNMIETISSDKVPILMGAKIIPKRISLLTPLGVEHFNLAVERLQAFGSAEERASAVGDLARAITTRGIVISSTDPFKKLNLKGIMYSGLQDFIKYKNVDGDIWDFSTEAKFSILYNVGFSSADFRKGFPSGIILGSAFHDAILPSAEMFCDSGAIVNWKFFADNAHQVPNQWPLSNDFSGSIIPNEYWLQDVSNLCSFSFDVESYSVSKVGFKYQLKKIIARQEITELILSLREMKFVSCEFSEDLNRLIYRSVENISSKATSIERGVTYIMLSNIGENHPIDCIDKRELIEGAKFLYYDNQIDFSNMDLRTVTFEFDFKASSLKGSILPTSNKIRGKMDFSAIEGAIVESPLWLSNVALNEGCGRVEFQYSQSLTKCREIFRLKVSKYGDRFKIESNSALASVAEASRYSSKLLAKVDQIDMFWEENLSIPVKAIVISAAQQRGALPSSESLIYMGVKPYGLPIKRDDALAIGRRKDFYSGFEKGFLFGSLIGAYNLKALRGLPTEGLIVLENGRSTVPAKTKTLSIFHGDCLTLGEEQKFCDFTNF